MGRSRSTGRSRRSSPERRTETSCSVQSRAVRSSRRPPAAAWKSAWPTAYRPGWNFTRITDAFAMSSRRPANQSRARKPLSSVLGQALATSRFIGHSTHEQQRTDDATLRSTFVQAPRRWATDSSQILSERGRMMRATTATLVQGHVEEGWGNVADAFHANFEGTPGEVGAACCVYIGGRPVVDV